MDDLLNIISSELMKGKFSSKISGCIPLILDRFQERYIMFSCQFVVMTVFYVKAYNS